MNRLSDGVRPSDLLALDGGSQSAPPPRQARAQGCISLLGAGPGDPELLTFKAAKRIASADVVVYDRLVGEGILALIPPTARKLYVGKRKSYHSVPQAEVNRLLVALAKQGLTVVRLKGGDPFIFGRGGEEMLAARAAGVACEIVPGVSSGVAAAAAAQIPLTHRHIAQAVTFVTGHATPEGKLDLDWQALARPNQTVVIYMGLSAAAQIAVQLLDAGRVPDTPIALIENASLPEERIHLSDLGGLAEASLRCAGPTVVLIGEVAGLAAQQGMAEAVLPPPRVRAEDAA